MNIQHLESLNDVVEGITGITQRETVPDAWVRAADQIELVDSTPEALRRRMAHGNIYSAERIDAALGNYFREGNLSALRELALLWLADRVDEALNEYRARHGIHGPWETRACRGGADGSARRRPSRATCRSHATRAKADLVGVHIRAEDGSPGAGGRACSTSTERSSASSVVGTSRQRAPTSPGRSSTSLGPSAPRSS